MINYSLGNLWETPEFVALAIIKDFNQKPHIPVMRKPWKFLKSVGGNFLSQVLSESTRKDALPDLLFVNTEGLMRDVMVGCCLGRCDHDKMILFNFISF